MNLNDALQSLDSDNLPVPLPLLHTTTVGRFEKILDQGFLDVTPCNIFKKNLLYFFYGGPFYRPNIPEDELENEDPTWLPVSIMLWPTLAADAYCFFPYDTGAANKNIYNGGWGERLSRYDYFRLDRAPNTVVPAKYVKYAFGGNENYMFGKILENSSDLPKPLQEILNFYRDRPTRTGKEADKRRCMVECLFDKRLDLADNMIWVSYPQIKDAMFFPKLKRIAGTKMPRIDPYLCHAQDEQLRIIGRLEEKAQKVLLEHRYITIS